VSRPPRLARRVVVAVTAITATTVCIAAAGSWFATRHILINGVDQDLARHGERLTRMVRAAPPGAWAGRPPRESRFLVQVAAIEPWTIVHAGGDLDAGDRLLGPGDRDPAIVALGDGRRVRRIILDLERAPPFVPSASAAGAVRAAVAMDLDSVERELERLALVLAVLWIAATGLALGAGLWLAPTTIRPLRRLAEALDRIGPDRLDTRVEPGTGPAEAQAVVDRLNRLLARLAESVEREKATVRAIAHELRTPVAVLRSDIEFRLLAGPGPDETRVLQANLAVVERMQALVHDLLALARLEAGAEAVRTEDIAIAPLIAAVVADHAGRAGERGLAFTVTGDDAVRATTSPAHLRMALACLVANAADHGEPGPIAITVGRSADGLCIAIANRCRPGIDPARVGEPFYRADPARSHAGHSGLGAALARRLARLLGGTIAVTVADGVFTATLTVP
jgi:signal transduction histidine kinase